MQHHYAAKCVAFSLNLSHMSSQSPQTLNYFNAVLGISSNLQQICAASIPKN